MELIFEKSKPGRKGYALPAKDVPLSGVLPSEYKRSRKPELPSVSEPEVIRHFTRLSQMNYGVDSNFYPLGSCTMKYNPKLCEQLASRGEFSDLHPLLPQLVYGGMLTQGALEIIYNLEHLLSEITGMDAFTAQPMAGAHGELTGAMLIAAYHKHRNDTRKHILIPDSGHGTNPASAAIAGFQVRPVPSNSQGVMDLEDFRKQLNGDTAGVMLTCPNTLGIFNPGIKKICDLAHEVGALVYYDGANMNAILGKTRPGDIGFDVVHLNLHKTFATPHGGGGPGAGPVGVTKALIPFLPISRVIKRGDGTFALHYDEPDSIGYISPFYGNFLVLLKAYVYILLLGRNGLAEVSENAVLNANYMLSELKSFFEPAYAYSDGCMHEFVLSAQKQAEMGVSAVDIAKAILDKGMYAPTIYFPLIVKEALMIEPTETETKETLDAFVKIMTDISNMAGEDPKGIKELPSHCPIGRLDEVKAAREMDLASIPIYEEG